MMTTTSACTKMMSKNERDHQIYSSNRSSPKTVSGILVVDKAEGLTSFAMVARVKNFLGLKKAGHCGTLDPFATGVLVICINQATRIADQLSMQDKLYRCSVRFGVETDTLDRTGRIVRTYDGPAVCESDLLNAAASFVGAYRQQVPRYAAVKVQGKRLYELARKGVEVERPSRDVIIHNLKLLGYDWPEAVMEVHCSKGAYIRQLTSDLGRELGCGAHVKELRRIASGSFDISRAMTDEELRQVSKNDGWREKLVSMNEALDHLAAIIIEDRQVLQGLNNGHLDPAWAKQKREQLSEQNAPVRLLAGIDRQLVALWWPACRDDTEKRRCLRVFK